MVGSSSMSSESQPSVSPYVIQVDKLLVDTIGPMSVVLVYC